MIQELADPKIVKKIAELLAMGYSHQEIRRELEKELNHKLNPITIRNIIKKFSIKKKEIIQTDKKFSEIYKTMLLELIEKAKDNLKILETTRDMVLNKLTGIQKEADTKSQGVNNLKQYLIDLKTIKDWATIANKVNQALRVLDMPEFSHDYSVMTYIREVNSAIRTQNDSIRTFIDILKQIEAETKQTKVSTVEAVYATISQLKELEQSGYIEIKKLPDHLKPEEEEE
jgi:hypothetical protein